MRMKKSTLLGVSTLLTAQMSLGQNFPPPPPIPPPPDMGGFVPPPPTINSGSGMRGGDTGTFGSAPGTSGINDTNKQGNLSKKQQDKFAKAGLEDITNENFPEAIESFDFPNVEITDVIKAISELTGKNFIIDPGVRGKITIVAPSKITVAEAYKAFLSALAINGFTVVPSGSFLKIKSARNAQRDSIETYSGAYYPNSDQMITRIIHLKHIQAEQVNRDLRVLTSKDGEMSVYTATNSLILSDYGSNIDRVMKILGQLDVPGFEDQIEVINIKYAKAKDLADLVDKIVNKGQKGGGAGGGMPGAFSAGVPRFTRSSGTSAQQGTSFFMAIPDDRTNSIIAMGNKSGILRLKKLIAQLDFRIRAEDSGGVYVYYVKNGIAKNIATTLQGVTKDAAPKPGGGGLLGGPLGGNPIAQQTTEIFGGDVKIQADESTNSLVITASKQDYEQVMVILRKLDIARDQVFVETVIMEMGMSDSNNWGIGYYKFGNGGGKVGFNSNITLSDMLSPTGGSGATLGFGSGDKVDIVTDMVAGTKVSISSLIGFINFIKTQSKGNILSTPQVLALDNQTAEIEVGDRVATSITQTTNAAGQITNSANFEDATIKLSLKPFISPASDTIRLEVDQKISQPTTNSNSPKVLSDNSQPLAKRNIKTTLVVRNKDTAVLGGLMKDSETEEISKVPLLGDLPIIGWLFKSRKGLKVKTNLLVFLTPTIIRNPADQKSNVDDMLDRRLKYIKAQGGRDPYGENVDRLAKKPVTPVDDNGGE